MNLTYKQVEQLAAITHGASNDSARPILTGVKLEWEVKESGVEVTAITTDSYLLAIRRILVVNDEGERWAGPGGSVLVNAAEFRKALTQIKKRTAEFSIMPTEEGVGVKNNDRGIEINTWIKAIEGKFPKWRALLREFVEGSSDVTFATGLIEKALKTANGINYVTLMTPPGGEGPRLWKDSEVESDPLDGVGWWCLQMPARA